MLDGKILVGHENGRIALTNIEGSSYQTISTAHYSGDLWAIEPVPDQGTFLTCSEDNEFHEISIASRRVLRTGKIFTTNFFNLENPNESKMSAMTAKPK